MALTTTQTIGAASVVTVDVGTFLNLVGNADWPDFMNRVLAALGVAAIAVLGEDSTVANFANRQALAKKVRDDPTGRSKALVWAVVDDNITAINSTDQALINRILAIWNTLAS